MKLKSNPNYSTSFISTLINIEFSSINLHSTAQQTLQSKYREKKLITFNVSQASHTKKKNIWNNIVCIYTISNNSTTTNRNQNYVDALKAFRILIE